MDMQAVWSPHDWHNQDRLPLYPPSYSIWIFTHLKLCLADATHNFKWMKIFWFDQTEVSVLEILQIDVMLDSWYLMCWNKKNDYTCDWAVKGLSICWFAIIHKLDFMYSWYARSVKKTNWTNCHNLLLQQGRASRRRRTGSAPSRSQALL